MKEAKTDIKIIVVVYERGLKKLSLNFTKKLKNATKAKIKIDNITKSEILTDLLYLFLTLENENRHKMNSNNKFNFFLNICISFIINL